MLQVPAGVRLDDEPSYAGSLGSGEQVVGALGAEPVRQREAVVELLEVDPALQRRHLVYDDLRADRLHRSFHRGSVEAVREDDARPVRPQPGRAGLRPDHPGHLVPGRDQLRHQRPAQSAGRTCYQRPSCQSSVVCLLRPGGHAPASACDSDAESPPRVSVNAVGPKDTFWVTSMVRGSRRRVAGEGQDERRLEEADRRHERVAVGVRTGDHPLRDLGSASLRTPTGLSSRQSPARRRCPPGRSRRARARRT